MDDCLFCRIIQGAVPSETVYQDDYVYAFRDISPQAPVHVLVVPREHIESSAQLNAENSHFAAKCFEAISTIAKNEALDSGFRVITNSGIDGGQSVPHLHFHLLGGKTLGAGLI